MTDFNEALDQVIVQMRQIPKKIDSVISKVPRLTEEQSMYVILFTDGLVLGIVIGVNVL